MQFTKTLLFVLLAGGLGGITSGVLVWALGATGITPALGFAMTPEMSLEWISGRTFASAIWGLIFLIPIFHGAPVLKGAVLGILPWLSSILIVFPFRMNTGFFGLEMGWGTPIWTLFFGAVWGVTGTLFLARYLPQSKAT